MTTDDSNREVSWGGPSGVLFVTGTDTGVGKTWVSCGLVRSLVDQGKKVAVRKPAETGCEERDGSLFPSDGHLLWTAAGQNESLESVCPIRLSEPLAPAAAAQIAGATLDPDAIVRDVRARALEVDTVLVEGAGGLLVPIWGRYRFVDLAADLEAQVLLVVAARLGAINHTLLSLELLKARGLDVVGYVVNHFSTEQDIATRTLVGTLAEQTDVSCLGEIAHGQDPAEIF